MLNDIGRPDWCGSTDDGGVKEEWFGNIKVGCGRSPTNPNAPGGYFPGMAPLEVNHINKNILDCDPVNLERLCKSCHKNKDMQTGVGESLIDDEFGYGSMLGLGQDVIIVEDDSGRNG